MKITELEIGKYYTFTDLELINGDISGCIMLDKDFKFKAGFIKKGQFYQIDNDYKFENPLSIDFKEIE